MRIGFSAVLSGLILFSFIGSADGATPAVVITEIMYHPYHRTPGAEDVRQEWIELLNRGAEPVNLAGWEFTDGIEYVFPQVTLEAGAYLVVAADVNVFSAQHPGVTNVVGGWTGWLSNSGERIELADREGTVVDSVTYADQGEWAVRELGPVDNGHRGWQWSDAHDGGGKSLELIDPAMPNEFGQNWAASLIDGGTPGKPGIVPVDDIAPMILEVGHQPIIPGPADAVTVTARILDEQTAGLVVTLHYRLDGSTYTDRDVYPRFNPGDYLSVPMLDDGAHDDQRANDGVFGGQIPAQADGSIVEFYVEARDAGGRTRTWPAPSLVDGTPQQVTNALYQVDSSFQPAWAPGDQPIYCIIMTEMERGRLAYIGTHSALSGPDSQMNATFISWDGTGMQLRYNVGIRNRGHGTRNGPPNNQHVAFASDHPWNGRFALNFNCRNTHSQIMGSVIFRMAGFVAAAATPVQLRINGANLATAGGPMYGVYAQLDALDSFFANQHFPGDPNGNLYTCFRTDGGGVEADLRFEGTNPDAYRNRYFKANNVSRDDWSDLIHLVDVLNNAPEDTYVQDVSAVINVPQWLRYIALDSLLMNNETGLNLGMGDDYFMYRGVVDPRFVLIPHDLDTILDQGGSVSQSIFSIVRGSGNANGVDGLKRFFNHPDIIPLYHQAMLDVMDEFFNPETLDPLFDQILGGFAPQSRITAMKQVIRQRTAAVLAQIPRQLTITSPLPVVDGYARTTAGTLALAGTASAARAKSVLVNGEPATWSPRDGTWQSGGALGLGESLVSTGAEWKYLDDGTDQGTVWQGLDFDDTPWRSGKAELGYGDGGEGTTVNGGPAGNRYITTYFRKSFVASNVSEYQALRLRLLRDDGAVVYLNGVEVCRSGMPEGPINSTTRAAANVAGDEEGMFFEYNLAPALLHDGTNLLAVEVHQNSPSSSDISFDLALEAVRPSLEEPSLLPGINRIVVQSFDSRAGAGSPVDLGFIDIWYDTGVMTTKAGGTLGADEIWTAADGPYHVTGSITIPAGRTLTIEPGTTVFLDSKVGFTVHGRLVAQGTEYRRIRFSRVPGANTQWAGFQIPDSREDNIIAYADLEFGGSRSQWITTGNNNGSIVGPTARLTIDHATFSGSDTQYFSIWDPQIIIRHSVFADLGSHYVCMAERMPADGWFIIEGNLFGHCHGDNDIFHLNSVSVKGGPVAQILNNVFTGGGDDIIDDNETDTHIEGNLFMHVNVGNSTRSASAAVTTGTGGGSASTNNLESQHLIVVRNIFYHGDYGILNKTGAYSEIYNNVFIQNAGAILLNEYVGSNSNQPGRAAYVENCIFWNNGPEVHGTSKDNGTGTFVNPENTQLTVNNSIVGSEFLDLGVGNIDADPLLVDADAELYVDMTLPRFGTGFPGFAEGGYLLAGMVPDVHLRPGSPARGTGFTGMDMGVYISAAASLGGVPVSPTPRTDATLIVGGTDVYGYKYRVAGPGFDNVWSEEQARMMPVTALVHSGVTATATVANHGLAIGDVVEVIGADRAVYNGQFTVTRVTSDTFSYTLASSVNLQHPDHLDVWIRKAQAIYLTGLANGTYTVSVVKKNSLGVWQDVNQPATATWTVDTSLRRVVVNEVLAVNQSVFEHEGTFPDMVELYYDGPTSLSLAGMSLTDDPEEPTKFVFPAGATIDPGQYLTLYADNKTTNAGYHLGFAFSAEGDGVYLYDRTGVLVDSVEFGAQLPDLSIGRVGDAGAWHLTVPTFGQANLPEPVGDPRTVRINEWLATEDVLFQSDFIELYNPQPLPVDLGNFYLTDTPESEPDRHHLRPLTFVPANGYLVFNADGRVGPGHLGFKLSSGGDMIALFDATFHRIDEVIFGPQTRDVSQGRSPDGDSVFAYFTAPTPGEPNPGEKAPPAAAATVTVTLLAEGADKRVLVPTDAISDDWRSGKPFDDSAWQLGKGAPGGVGYENDQGYESLITVDTKAQMFGAGKNNTCYIRIPFAVDAAVLVNVKKLILKVRYDDGLVAYLNGKEVARRGFAGTPTWDSRADSSHEAAVAGYDDEIDISPSISELKAGDNLLAVQGLNTGSTSSDFLITVALDGVCEKAENGGGSGN